MKKSFLLIISLYVFLQANSQSLIAEKNYIDSLIQSGTLSSDQLVQMGNKYNNFIKKYNYPLLPLNKTTGKVDFSDLLICNSLDKKVIFERCLEWIAFNYGNLLHKDQESGKIIASGLINLTYDEGNRNSFGTNISQPFSASLNYTLILTIKDNKIKYNIINIEYTFVYYTETINEIIMPIASLFPIITKDEKQWKRYTSVLKESTEILTSLKYSLMTYVNNYENDYNF